MTPSEDAALLSLKAQVERELGVSLAWGDDPEFVPEKLPTGIPQIDAALGGGFSFRRITLLVGEESAGKTLLAMQAIKAAQARNLPVVFLDVERSWTSEWARTVGIEPDGVIVSSPDDGEAAFDVARAVVKTEPAGVLVLDSLAAMPPARELTESTGSGPLGQQARMINSGIKLLNAQNDGGWCVLIVNQIREKVGISYGSPETLPGGKGQRYYAWQIVRVRRGAKLEEGTGDNKRVVGRMLRIKLDKSKQGPPEAEAEVPFYFTGVFDVVSGLLDQAIELDVVQARGGWYTFGEHRWQGRRAFREAFDDEELLAELRAALEAREIPDL